MGTMKKILALSGGKDSLACLHLLKDELDSAIYVDTGFAYPETLKMIDYAATLLTVHRVQANRTGQQAAFGLPADVVPVEWTAIGEAMTEQKPYRIQSSFQCCFENIALPLYAKAHALGATHLVMGQRNAESYKSLSRDGDLVKDIIRLHPIEDWTTDQVMQFLSKHMTVPAHFNFEHSSLDCYDCTAFRHASADRVKWMKYAHPEMYNQYVRKSNAVTHALELALG
jgi:phosphoadenosine phosphosulfate reductase